MFFFAQMTSDFVHYYVIYYPFPVVCEGLTAPQYATNTDEHGCALCLPTTAT